jgi:hypothetical protein
MIDKASSNSYREFADSLYDQFQNGVSMSPKQIAAIRKWEQ